MKSIEVNKELIAACGLYCGACRKYLSDKCPGCRKNEKATWCKIRSCVNSQGFHSCAECSKNVRECKIYSNFIGMVFAFIFRSDRPACIRYIREHGEQAFAEEMTKRKCQTIKRINKTMFIAILTYKKPLSEVDRFLAAHREYLAKHYALGDFIASGPQTPRVGGVIMIKAENRTAVDAIIAKDPFNINGIADYQIVEFNPTMFCDAVLSNFLL